MGQLPALIRSTPLPGEALSRWENFRRQRLLLKTTTSMHDETESDKRGYITPIPIRETAIPPAPKPQIKRAHEEGRCGESCKYLTPKEHDRLAYLESAHMGLLVLQSNMWFEFVRLKELSDQAEKWRAAYSSAIDVLISKAIQRGQIRVDTRSEAGEDDAQQQPHGAQRS